MTYNKRFFLSVVEQQGFDTVLKLKETTWKIKKWSFQGSVWHGLCLPMLNETNVLKPVHNQKKAILTKLIIRNVQTI